LASFVGEEGEENEEKKMGGDREAWRRKWADMDGVYQERGAKPPPPMKCSLSEKKLTESVAQPYNILCTENQNFKIIPSECTRYPPKCAFSRVSNEKFSGRGCCSPLHPIQRRWRSI